MQRRQPKRGRLRLSDGFCVRLRAFYPGHVWAYDFVQHRAHDGRRFRITKLIDEYTRECLAIMVARRLISDDVQRILTDLFERGPPVHMRFDNVLEFVAKVVRGRVGVTKLFVEPAGPRENGYNASFNGKLRDVIPDRETFCSPWHTEVLIEHWRRHDNTGRLHRALGQLVDAAIFRGFRMLP